MEYFDRLPAAICERGLLALDVAENELGDGWALELADALRSDDWLLAVNVGDNRLGPRGLDLLKAAVVFDRRLSKHTDDAPAAGALLSLRLGKCEREAVDAELDARLARRDASGFFRDFPQKRQRVLVKPVGFHTDS